MSSTPRVAATQPAAIYVRVSSDGQAAGTSLDTQQDACVAYAQALGLDVAHIFRETFTGVTYFERPAMTELRALMREQAVGHVVFYVVDRASRGGAYAALLHHEAVEAGVALYQAENRWVVPMSRTGEVMMYLEGWKGRGEWEDIRERTLRGRKARLASKGLPGVGPRPLYGYQWVTGQDPTTTLPRITKLRLEPNPATAPVVQRIFSAYAGGVSLRSLCAQLTAEGVPTATGRRVWLPSSLSSILRHPGYTGRGTGWNGELALPDGLIPALVDQHTWDTAQARLAVNKLRAVRNNKHPEGALLRGGFARCGYCAWAMQAHWVQSVEGPVYTCPRGQQVAGGCRRHGITARLLDAAVWAKVAAVLNDPEVIEREVRALLTSDPTEHDTGLVERALADVVRRQENVARRVASIDDDDVALPLMAELKQLATRRSALEADLATLVGRRDAWQAAMDQLEDVRTWRERVAANLTTLDYREKRTAIEALGVRVDIYGRDHDPRFVVTARIPLRTDIAYSSTRGCRRQSRTNSAAGLS
jgi:site-specific DNA recombinase